MSLNDIFEAQRNLNLRLFPNLYTSDIEDPEIKRQRFLQYMLALQQEGAEAVNSLNWKWWKKDEEDWDNIKVELVDMLHFWVSMCTIAGMSAEEVIDMYFKKNKLNHDRQDKGYKEGTYDKYESGVEDNKRFVLDS